MKQKMKRFWQRVTADKKRFSLLCSLLLIALLLWARIIVIARPPKTAIADQTAIAAIIPIQTSDNDPIPVILDRTPLKNPFVVNNTVYPLGQRTTDNHFVTQSTPRSPIIEGYELEAVMGNLAMIDGKVYQIGDVLAGAGTVDPLTIMGVEGRSVIISAGDRRYELTLASSSR